MWNLFIIIKTERLQGMVRKQNTKRGGKYEL